MVGQFYLQQGNRGEYIRWMGSAAEHGSLDARKEINLSTELNRELLVHYWPTSQNRLAVTCQNAIVDFFACTKTLGIPDDISTELVKVLIMYWGSEHYGLYGGDK